MRLNACVTSAAPIPRRPATAMAMIDRAVLLPIVARSRLPARAFAAFPLPLRFCPNIGASWRTSIAASRICGLTALPPAILRGLCARFLGADAPLSAATITRTNQLLCKELDAWNARRLDNVELVFTWADGVYLGAGPDDERRVFLGGSGCRSLRGKAPAGDLLKP